METFIRDIKQGFRRWAKNPGFAFTVIATMALSIGATTAIFSIVESVLLRPLPFVDPGRLVWVAEVVRGIATEWSFSYPEYLDCRQYIHSFSGLAAWRNDNVNLITASGVEYVRSKQISANFAQVLGLTLTRGRSFTSEEDLPSGAPVAIISYKVWQDKFGGRDSILGTSITLDSKSYIVVGVMPADFVLFGEAEVYTPIGQNDNPHFRQRNFRPGVKIFGRLKPAVTMTQASDEMQILAANLAHEFPDTNSRRNFVLRPLRQELVASVERTLLLLLGAVSFVLLMACANVANLFLAQSVARTQEFSVRAALGARWQRLVSQLVVEGGILSLLGGSMGFLLSWASLRWAASRLSDYLPRAHEISPDIKILGFTLSLSLLTGIFFGLIPAVWANGGTGDYIVHSARRTRNRLRRTQNAFVIVEMSLAIVLLICTGLMVRTVINLWSQKLGFDPNNVLTVDMALPPNVTMNPSRIRSAWHELLANVESIPQVKAAAVNTLTPLSGNDAQLQYWIGNSSGPQKDLPSATVYTPSPGYFEALAIPLLRGRSFDQDDRLGSEPVVIVDDVLAQRAFGGQDIVGRTLSIQFLGAAKIVGIVPHVKQTALDESGKSPAREQVYVPFDQIPDPFMKLTASGITLLVRTTSESKQMMNVIRRTVAGPGHDRPIRNIRRMDDIIGDSIERQRLMLLLLETFAAAAVLLTFLGIYGIVAYSTKQRSQEIAIRLALGATPSRVLIQILWEGLAITGIGLAIGFAASFLLTRLIAGLLFRITPNDPLTITAVAFLIVVIAVLATYFAAKRAARLSPMSILRYE